MQVVIEHEEALQRILAIEVPLEEVSQAYDAVYAKMRGQLQVPGFRPGKFPRELAEKRFKAAMASEALQDLVPKYYEQALSELNLKPATRPDFQQLEIDRNEPLKFRVEFEIKPQFDLPPTTDFSLVEKPVDIDAEAVKKRASEMHLSRADYEETTEAAQVGDKVVFDFEGRIDGVPFEGNSAKDYQLELGSNTLLPEFETEMAGVTKGIEKTFDVKFPDNYPSESGVTGKMSQFSVNVKQVLKKTPPAWDATFFVQFGSSKTEAEFLTHVRTELENEMRHNNQQAYRLDLMEQIEKQSDFEVPTVLVKAALEEYDANQENQNAQQLDAENEEKSTEATSGNDTEAKRNQEKERIQSSMRAAYIIEALGEDWKIEVNSDLIKQRFNMQAYMFRQDPSQLIQTEFGSRILSRIHQNSLQEQVLDHLIKALLPSIEEKPAALDSPATVDVVAEKDSSSE